MRLPLPLLRAAFFFANLSLLALFASGCGRAPSSASAEAGVETRIVSVGSAVTETVYALGAADKLVGVDTSSLFPEAATKLPQVGYQRTLSAEGILALKPTLVLASSEAGPPAVLEQLKSAGVRVESIGFDPTLAGAKARIAKIAEILGKDPKKVIDEMDSDLARAEARLSKATSKPKVMVIYARGANALHVFGANTASGTLVQLAGGVHAVTGFEGSKPLTSESVVTAAPDVIVIPSRGLESLGGVDGLLKVPGVSETPAWKNKRIVPMDDLLLLGLGNRTGRAVLELGEKIHPELGEAK